ncbi:uncharacterized protein RAG0_01188 [Rhynchosporium agropyri]|uniref:SMODS and SLOG-associating 2TM effector domain-containing protein n=1 Tax=Rhynchosporium agropyri TaxID=914238 RepID=A0A1E1JVY3_9HELO|nr:uncharacterized protein RAG0_01188 [Rhynchosporium agropyri]
MSAKLLNVEEAIYASSSQDSDSKRYSSFSERPPSVFRLSAADHALLCQSIGALSDDENHKLSRPHSHMYPPKGLPNGLYKDVIRSRTLAQYEYYFTSLLFTVALVLQLLLGAALTALGSTSASTNLRITLLAAANTILAGLLAPMHNSGLPERYKNDWTEFDEVEMFMRELVETGIIAGGWTRDQTIEHCYALYRRAKGTVTKNKPTSYKASGSASSSFKASKSVHKS